ncbi:MAG: hypothetical protein NVV67_03540 [Pseudoxanthomonas sp.]|nr:hypothetical protein [Pseudoxanthomonas sp.]
MPLPDAYRWSDSADGSSHLYWNYGFVASVASDGATKIKLWDKREIHAKAASVAQAKRFIERWLLAQRSERARECARLRARSRASSATQPRKFDDASRFLKQQARPADGRLSSRIIKVDKLLPDDFESVADVREPLQAFAPHADNSRIRRRRMLVMPSVG